MTFKCTPVIFLMLFFTSLLVANTTTKIAFIENDLEAAKHKAQAAGKLIMVDFWADWCSPCKWMDEQTFNRPEVANYLNDNYISVRVNIDNLDGIAYKTQYDIRFLPTIMILDPGGKVVRKYEESMAPSKLLRVLKNHDEHKVLPPYVNRNMVQTISPKKKEVRTAPTFRPVTTGNSTMNLSENNRKNRVLNSKPSKEHKIISVSNPSNTANNYKENSAGTPTNTSNVYKASSPGKVTNRPYKNFSVESNEAISDVGLYQLNVKKAPRHGFSVQVGAYYDYKNVLVEVAKFQKAFAEEVLVHISVLNGTTCYKVMLGHYNDHGAATKDKVLLKEAGAIDAFVKDLSAL